MNILLVEDNPGDILLAQEALKDILDVTYRLFVVRDGLEAMDFVFKRNEYQNAPSPHIILLDLHIPKHSGLEVLQAIKENPATRVIPVAVFSTSDSHLDVQEAYLRHANCYLTKPMDYNAFVFTLENLFHFWFQVASPLGPNVVENGKRSLN